MTAVRSIGQFLVAACLVASAIMIIVAFVSVDAYPSEWTETCKASLNNGLGRVKASLIVAMTLVLLGVLRWGTGLLISPYGYQPPFKICQSQPSASVLSRNTP